MRKAVFQNWMALDIITPLKGDTCAIIQNIVACNWYIIFIKSHKNPSECSEGSEPQSKRLHKSVLLLGEKKNTKKLLFFGIIILICVFSCNHLYYCCGICLQCSQNAIKWNASMLAKPLADHSRCTVEEGCAWGCKGQELGLERVERGRRSWGGHDPSWLTHKLDPGRQRLFTSSRVLRMYTFAHCSHSGCSSRDSALREQCVIPICGRCMWLNPVSLCVKC